MSSHRGEMGTLHCGEETRSRLGTPTDTEGRLPGGQAAVVIAGLSALSWAALITIVVAFHTVL